MRVCVGLVIFAAAVAGPASAVEVFVAIDPCRIFDTRPEQANNDAPALPNTNFVGSPAQPLTVRTVTIQGNAKCPVPATGVSAVVGNVIAVQATASGFLTIFPQDVGFQGASHINFPAATDLSHFATDNGGILPLDADPSDGDLGLAWDTTTSSAPGTHTVHVVIDVTGYFVQLEAGAGLQTAGNGLAIQTPYQLPQTGCLDDEVVTSDGLGGWSCEPITGGGGGAGLLFNKGDVYEVSSPSSPIADGASGSASAACNDATDIAIEFTCEPNPNSDLIVTDEEIANWAGTTAAASVSCDFLNVAGGDTNNGNGHAIIYCLPAD
jgi:hypothetical protein